MGHALEGKCGEPYPQGRRERGLSKRGHAALRCATSDNHISVQGGVTETAEEAASRPAFLTVLISRTELRIEPNKHCVFSGWLERGCHELGPRSTLEAATDKLIGYAPWRSCG